MPTRSRYARAFGCIGTMPRPTSSLTTIAGPGRAVDRRVRRGDRSVEDRVDRRRAIAQQRAEPERQPVDEDGLGRLRGRDGCGQIGPDVDGRPVGRSFGTVAPDPVVEFLVARPGSRRGTTPDRRRRVAASWRGRTGSCRSVCRRARGSGGTPSSVRLPRRRPRAARPPPRVRRSRPSRRRRGHPVARR